MGCMRHSKALIALVLRQISKVTDILVKEQAEEVFTVTLHLCVLAEVWGVEQIGVRNPDDVVGEAGEQNIRITWPDANISQSLKV